MSTEETNEQQYDSDKDFEKPKDEFMFYYQAYKPEEKKIINHIKFEQITASYWQLLRSMPEQDTNKTTVSKEQYIELMKRVYKVLLPLYRQEEMVSEIEEEWVMDSRGQAELNQNLLSKVLFRIAHWWGANIDIDEYIDLLQKVFQRITCKVVYDNQYTYEYTYKPEIYVTFPQDEKKLADAGGKVEKAAFSDEWMECRSDESSRSDYEYKYEEDTEKMVLKKYKKPKGDANTYGGAAGGNNLTIKDPFIYSEDVIYPKIESGQDFRPGCSQRYVLHTLEEIFPFGYPTEQFLRYTKNDVYQKIQEAKAQNRQNYSAMSKLEKENDNSYSREKDTGLAEEKGEKLELRFDYWGRGVYSDYFTAKITDSLYNSFRKLLRDGVNVTLRMFSQYPKPGQRSKARSSLNSTEPILEINKFGYNPALERRVQYKLLPMPNRDTQYINVNYLIVQSDFEVAYRCDVQRIETKGKMAIKETDEMKKDEDFVNVETSYKKLRQIMLTKKFESIFSDRANSDNKEQKRLKKVIEKEDKRRANALKAGNIAQKGLSETYEEKSFIKMMKGPFYQLDSKEGLTNDDFYICSEQDLIDAAKTPALRILVIGKPRSGKTLLAKNLALKLDLVHINIDNWIAALLNKIKTYEPPELEEGQEPPKFLTDIEDAVNIALQQGTGPTDEQIIEIISSQIHSAPAILKGYVLDLSYYQREQPWASTIRQRKLLGETYDGKQIEFSHVVEIWADDEDIKLRALHMRANPDDGNVYSRWEREERKKPKPVVEDEGEAPEEDEENAIKPFDELALIQRPNDMDFRIKEELQHYNTVERPSMEELLINFFDNQYIRVEAAGLTPDQLTESVQSKIKFEDDLPLRPLAIQIEGGGDFKSLLTEGLEEGQLARKWSLWKQIDPVALSQGKVIQGLPEYACHYNGNVFVFSSEENMKSFIAEPKKYLQDRPSMPSIFRVLMLGPKGTGKHTQAQLLSETYGWRIVDFKEIVKAKLEEMMKLEIHIPNNPVAGGRIGLSEQELQEVVEGKPFPAWKYIPWILDYLGFQLDKRKPPPPEEKKDEEEEELDEETKKKREAEAKKKALEEEKKRKEEEELQRQKEERRKRREEAREQGLDLAELGLEESEEEPIIIEDLSIDQLVLKEDEQTGKLPYVGGFILLGFPETEEQINRLKAHGIEFDKIIYLTDTNEEDPGKEIKKRMNEAELYDYDWEFENSQRVLGLAKEHLGEDFVREISCNGTPDTVFIRLRNEIDPFYLKIDNPDDVRVSADLGEEDKKLPKGDFGDYCPVTYVQDKWLVRGNPEQEVTIFGKTYWLAGEKEAELFKFNPKKFLIATNGEADLPLQPPPPKIMIMGHRGAGVTTVIRMLCEKFKLDEFLLKQEFLNKLKEEKEKRKRKRLLDRGFRPPLPAEEEGMEPPPDPEIEEDPEDFDKEGHERAVLKMIFDSNKGYVIDGTWRELPEGAVNQSLQDLLFESRRVPEIVIILKCKEQSTFQRIINFDSIKAEYDRLMEVRANERKRQRDEDREKFLEGLKGDEEKTEEDIQNELAKWEEDRDAEEEAAEENDPEKPNYDDMVEKEREALREARTADDTFFEEFATVLKDKQVFVIDDIKSDTSAEFVLIKLLDRMKDNFQFRKDLIERQLAQPLKPEEVKFFEKSYIYKHSKYGVNSPLTLACPSKSKKHATLYRERLYFLANEDQQQQFLKEPSRYTEVETIPLDIQIKPRIFILGLPKSGKSTLAQRLVEKIGIVHLKMSKIIQEFIDQDSAQGELMRKVLKIEGKAIEDDLLVSLLLKRIQLKDCQTKGWILEDFPKTRNQAMFLAKRGLVPSHVIMMKQKDEECYKRTEKTKEAKFGHNRIILAERINFFQQNYPHIVTFYQKLYNNVIEIDSLKSKWFIEDRAITEIQKNLEARQNFARDYFLRDSRACKMKNLSVDRCLLKQALSEFRYYCPVTWRNEKLLAKCNENTEDCLLFKNCFFYFKSQKERDMFISNPGRFLQHSSLPRPQDLPLRLPTHKAAEIVVLEKALNAHCPVTLMDEERVTKADLLLVIAYKESKYAFHTEHKLQRFQANPFKYSKATLPVKMPPPDDKVSLYNLQRMEDSIAFMEQSLGQIVTRGLREVSENRLKYPTLGVKETMLKLFALFLKTENPANTESMKRKYAAKMKQFIQRCELPEEIYDLAMEKEKKKPKSLWPEFKENYYNDKGAEYDRIISIIAQEKQENFVNYIR